MDPVVVRRARNGRGLFAARAFRSGTVIVHLTGRIVPADLLWERGGVFADNCFRFGPETYLDPGDGYGRYVNHACEPNAFVHKERNRLYLVAARPVRRGGEIVIDYATILGDDDIWTMRCNCGRHGCRGRVKRVGALPPELFARYTARRMIPRYILATLGNVPR